MKLKNILCLSLIFLFALPNYSQNFIFEGIIGKKEAVLGFEYIGNEYSNAQYYLKQDKAIVPLEINELDSQTILFYTLDANNEDTFSTFTLSFGANRLTINGIYKGNDGLKEEAYFTWLDITKINHRYAQHYLTRAYKTEIPFLYVYTSDIQFNKTVKQINAGKYDALQIVKNWPNEIPSIRFINANDKEQKIEAFCDSIGLEQVMAHLDCGLDYSVNLEVQRFDREIVSLLYKVSWNCGGSIKDYYYQGYTFNRKTGEQILLKDLIQLKNEETSNDSLNKAAVKWNEKQIRGMFTSSLKNDGTSLCDYDNYPIFGDKNFYVTANELHLLPTFPAALESCRSSAKSHINLKEIGMIYTPLFKALFLTP